MYGEPPSARSARFTAPSPGVSVDSLVATLELEARLLDELLVVIREQRAGVAGENVDRVNDSVFAAHRVIRTMNEARTRRRTLVGALTGSEDVGLEDLEASLGSAMTDAVREARSRVQATARTLSREIELNRRILRDALRSGDEYMRALFGSTLAAPGYDAEARTVGGTRPSGVLINRQV